MQEYIEDLMFEAREELKRLEHILYVSLKYTRTIDVIRGALERIVSIYDLIIEALLAKAQEEGKIPSIAKSPARRSLKLEELYEGDEEMEKFLRFYLFTRTLLNSEYSKRREFRRHVTFIVELENATAEINCDNLLSCEKFVQKFWKYAKRILFGEEEQEE